MRLNTRLDYMIIMQVRYPILNTLFSCVIEI